MGTRQGWQTGEEDAWHTAPWPSHAAAARPRHAPAGRAGRGQLGAIRASGARTTQADTTGARSDRAAGGAVRPGIRPAPARPTVGRTGLLAGSAAGPTHPSRSIPRCPPCTAGRAAGADHGSAHCGPTIPVRRYRDGHATSDQHADHGPTTTTTTPRVGTATTALPPMNTPTPQLTPALAYAVDAGFKRAHQAALPTNAPGPSRRWPCLPVSGPEASVPRVGRPLTCASRTYRSVAIMPGGVVLLDLPVVLPHRGARALAIMPGGVVPDQQHGALAVLLRPLRTPRQEGASVPSTTFANPPTTGRFWAWGR
jgi:hypothetical protein